MKYEKVLLKRNNKVIYKDGDRVIKVFDNSFSKSAVLKEALNLSLVEEAGLNVPELCEITEIEGKFAIVYKYIEGTPLSELIFSHPSKEDEYLNLFVDTQIDILSKKSPNSLVKVKDKMNERISQTRNLIEATVRYELHTSVLKMKDHAKICHGDFVPENIIITPDNQVYVLDWSHTTQGNASSDAAKTYINLNLQNQKDFADKYIKLFCKKSDIPLQLVQQWLPIVAAAEMASSDEEKIEKLKKWVKTFDY